MQLPNKLYSYRESVLSKFPIILKALNDGDYSVGELYIRVSDSVTDANEFLTIIDCLYALGKIAYDENEEVLTYVD